MGATVFDLKRPKKKVVKQQENLVELDKKVIPAEKMRMTYVDIDGLEKEITGGGYSKMSNGSYVINKTEIDKYDIYEKYAYTYKGVGMHFTYIDASGKERVFNRLETLSYNEETSTYIGEVGNIEYIETEVELTENL